MPGDGNPTLTAWGKSPYRFPERLGETPRRPALPLCGVPARKQRHGVTGPGGTVTPVPFSRPRAGRPWVCAKRGSGTPRWFGAVAPFEPANARDFVGQHVLVELFERGRVRDRFLEQR